MRLDDSVLCEILRLRKAEKKSYAAIARATDLDEVMRVRPSWWDSYTRQLAVILSLPAM